MSEGLTGGTSGDAGSTPKWNCPNAGLADSNTTKAAGRDRMESPWCEGPRVPKRLVRLVLHSNGRVRLNPPRNPSPHQPEGWPPPRPTPHGMARPPSPLRRQRPAPVRHRDENPPATNK